MRTFNSYGPINSKKHYYVPREKLVKKCVYSLVGDPNESGHYFTIWGARQTGKTWLYRESIKDIINNYGDKFIVGEISMQGIVLEDNDNPTLVFLNNIQILLHRAFSIKIEPVKSWIDLMELFTQDNGVFKKPLILIIDEFDKLPITLIDKFVSLFREMYLNRNRYMLHGLALVGVRAVLGVESTSGSPFNIQRSLHVSNLSLNEVESMFTQYHEESKQNIEHLLSPMRIGLQVLCFLTI